jgi:hypothetical protein
MQAGAAQVQSQEAITMLTKLLKEFSEEEAA